MFSIPTSKLNCRKCVVFFFLLTLYLILLIFVASFMSHVSCFYFNLSFMTLDTHYLFWSTLNISSALWKIHLPINISEGKYISSFCFVSFTINLERKATSTFCVRHKLRYVGGTFLFLSRGWSWWRHTVVRIKLSIWLIFNLFCLELDTPCSRFMRMVQYSIANVSWWLNFDFLRKPRNRLLIFLPFL